MKENLAAAIVEHLEKGASRPLKRKEIARALGVGEDRYAELTTTLDRLVEEGHVYRIKHQRFALPGQINLVVGRLDGTRAGAGFVVPDQPDAKDVFVQRDRLAGAVHGDRVVARIERQGRNNPEGSIIRVLERAREDIVGALHRRKKFGVVTPDNPRLKFEVYVADDQLGGASDGDKVVVLIEEWGDGQRSPSGRVSEVIGAPDDPGVDIVSIIRSHGLDTTFSDDVEKAAAAIRMDVAKEIERREDFRDRKVFTIDPHDAQDFDDALSIERNGGDGFEVGIHIADVSHFVTPGGAIDDEARERATSVYLVDRVLPMLPERLSNDLCSLVPGHDRLAYSVIVGLDRDATVVGYRIRETVIRSTYRLDYREAQALIEGDPPRPELKDVQWEIQTLRGLAKALQRKRSVRGSLDFDLPEAAVELDEEGYPIDIKEKVRLDSMRLIEEFMLLANEIVARHAVERDVPFIYRVHDRPAEDRIERLRPFVAACGLALPASADAIDPVVLSKILDGVRGKPEESLLNTMILRSMKQARYQVDNVGHFGLASSNYGHFTSPIRRYPDLISHRIMKRVEHGEKWKRGARRDAMVADLAAAAEHASTRERVAVQAERDSVDLKKVEFMERHVGDTFAGTVSGVLAFGFFVQLVEYFVEGLVHVHDLGDDYYEFHEERFALVGRNKGRRFRLADPVRVRVASVDKELRRIELELMPDEA